jgi:hypothetical protein
MAKSPELDLREDYGRNYLLNSDMRLAQRGTSFTAIANAAYHLDRYQYSKVGAMVHTVTQDTDAPTLAESGYLFQNSLRYNLTTPDTSLAAGDICTIRQSIEGYNFANLAQKKFTLSFWVKATTPGIYCVAFLNAGVDRSYVAEYTITSSEVWEKKTITVLASPSTGTWNYTNSLGLRVVWTIASGSTYHTTAGAWQTGEFIATANQVNGTNTGSTNFRITGVMINEGAEALPFRTAGKTFGGELALCQRYYEKSYSLDVVPGAITTAGAAHYSRYNGTSVTPGAYFKVEKRTAPIITLRDTASGAAGSIRNLDANSPVAASAVESTTSAFSVDTALGVDTTVAYRYQWTADAEL